MATAAIAVTGLSIVVVAVNARPDRSLPSVDGEPASPSTAPVGDAWVPNLQYAVGAQVTYAGVGYRCRQAHRSLVTWEPPNTPALWQRL